MDISKNFRIKQKENKMKKCLLNVIKTSRNMVRSLNRISIQSLFYIKQNTNRVFTLRSKAITESNVFKTSSFPNVINKSVMKSLNLVLHLWMKFFFWLIFFAILYLYRIFLITSKFKMLISLYRISTVTSSLIHSLHFRGGMLE